MPHRPSDELVQHLQALNLMMLLFLVRLKAPQFSLMWNTMEAFFTTKTSDTASLATFAREHHEQRQKQQSLIKTAHPNATIAASRGKKNITASLLGHSLNSLAESTLRNDKTQCVCSIGFLNQLCQTHRENTMLWSSHDITNDKTQCFCSNHVSKQRKNAVDKHTYVHTSPANVHTFPTIGLNPDLIPQVMPHPAREA